MFNIGDIVYFEKNDKSEKKNNYKIKPCVVILEKEDDLYYIPISSGMDKYNKKRDRCILLSDNIFYPNRTSFIDIDNINKNKVYNATYTYISLYNDFIVDLSNSLSDYFESIDEMENSAKDKSKVLTKR